MSFSVEFQVLLLLVVFVIALRSGWHAKHLLSVMVNVTIAIVSFLFFFLLLFKPPNLSAGLLYSLTYMVGMLISYNLGRMWAKRPKKEKPAKEKKPTKEKDKKEKPAKKKE